MCKLDPGWGALLISIVGSFAGPYFTAKKNNEHELEMRTMDIQERLAENYDQNRREAICSFMSSVGEALAYGDRDALKDLGRDFFGVYPYVSDGLRERLDSFYRSLVVNDDFSNAQKVFPEIAADLSVLLKQEPPEYPPLHSQKRFLPSIAAALRRIVSTLTQKESSKQ